MSVDNCARRAFGQDKIRDGLRARFGFTLIELLVVVAIIATLAAVLFPVITAAKQSAKKTACSSNLKQLNIEYAWDFVLRWSSSPLDYRFGLLARYTKNHQINSCPSFFGNGWSRPYTGYAYNTTYIGGDTIAGGVPCVVGEIARPSRKVVFADAGFGNPVSAQNYLRAPSDPFFAYGKIHFRHNGLANAAYADGHVAATGKKYRFDPKEPECGALSQDDSAYELR